MFPIFPNPFPDELLFGLLTRLSHSLLHPSQSALTTLLVGSSKVFRPSIFFPSDFDRVLGNLPGNHTLGKIDLVSKHTLHPLFDQDPSAIRYLGKPKGCYLFSCESCRKSDASEYGIAYWHRSHQIPGALVCYRHRTPLQWSLSNQGPHPRESGRQRFLLMPEEIEWMYSPPEAPGLLTYRDDYHIPSGTKFDKCELESWFRFHQFSQSILSGVSMIDDYCDIVWQRVSDLDSDESYADTIRKSVKSLLRRSGREIHYLYRLPRNPEGAARAVLETLYGPIRKIYHLIFLLEALSIVPVRAKSTEA